METYYGTICAFAFNFPPYGWAFCDGSILNIQAYTPLFSLLGTTYGGDGRTTFGLPNLIGRGAMHVGTSKTGVIYDMGEIGGSPTATITAGNMPVHTHVINTQLTVNNGRASATAPVGNYLAVADNGNDYSTSGGSNMMAAATLPLAIASTPNPTANTVNVQTAYQVLNYCIAVQGSYFPSRN